MQNNVSTRSPADGSGPAHATGDPTPGDGGSQAQSSSIRQGSSAADDGDGGGPASTGACHAVREGAGGASSLTQSTLDSFEVHIYSIRTKKII